VVVPSSEASEMMDIHDGYQKSLNAGTTAMAE
jgi:hypothetical protein